MDAYVNYVFQISVHEWYTAFSTGFLKVCGGKVLELFQPSELRAMMVGSSNYNWEELEEVSIKGAIFSLRGSRCARAPPSLRAVCVPVGCGGLLHLSGSLLLSNACGLQTARTIFCKIHFFLFVFWVRLPSTRGITQPHIPL